MRAALNWAHSQGYLPEPTKLKLKPSERRSRPVTGEEYDRLIMAVDKVRRNDGETWRRYLRGLWLSGLRLGESLILSWDHDEPLCVDMSGRHIKLRISDDVQKSGKYQLLPIAPEFAEFLLSTPEAQRQGLVFPLMGSQQMSQKRVSKVVSSIGKRANVNVSDRRGVIKWTSAHDLRRAFGTRWARVAAPAMLKSLMRHGNINSTMQYYVSLDADDVADQLAAICQHNRQHSPAPPRVR